MPTPQQLSQIKPKLTIQEVREQHKPGRYVELTLTMDDDSTVDVAFRFPKYLEVQAFTQQIQNPATGAIKAQIGLLRMLCLTHDVGQLETMFDQLNGPGFIIAAAAECMRLINDGVGVEVKKG